MNTMNWLVVGSLVFGAQEVGGKVEFDSLVEGLVKLDWLATPPGQGEKCIQFSSYDRASEKGKGNAEAWYGNNDCGVYLRTEKVGDRTEYVMADVDGPGAVVRIWSANPDGDLRFYFDGEKEARFTVPFQELCGGKKEPFVEPLCGVHASGWNCYIPFPFGKHLKITASKGGFYYHVNVRLFPKNTEVPTFTKECLASTALAAARAILRKDPLIEDFPESFEQLGHGGEIDPGEAMELAFEGPAVLRYLRAEPKAEDLRTALRSARIQMFADGEARPSVDAPLGDFFATSPDFTQYATYPAGVRSDGNGYFRLPVPFARSLKILVTNEGKEGLELALGGAIEKTKNPPPLRLHAKYRQAVAMKTQPRSDYVILDAEGPGRFVGCSLSVRNPVKAWWGEGDEHAWVDGEKFPSTFGTGTEDYFGYAWCDPHPFNAAFHSQSRCDGPANRGFTSVNRFHIGDAIPFHERILFDLEVWHWANTEVDYASVAYWYAPPNAKDAMPALPAAKDRLARPIPPVASKVAGAIEGESLAAKAKITGGKLQVQDMAGFGEAWSRDEHLWWTGAKPKDRLDLPFEVAAAGNVGIRAQLTKAADYGIVAFAIDGKPLGEPFDGYNNGVAPSGEILLGRADLAAGAHTLSVTIVGANPKAIPAHMVGIDYFVVRP